MKLPENQRFAPFVKRRIQSASAFEVLAGWKTSEALESRASKRIEVRAPAAGRWELRGTSQVATAWLGLVLLPLLLLCGCSTFNRDWKKAAQPPPPPESIEGRWEGKWTSEVNGHTGNLRCLVTREGDNRCAARFRATYAKVFRFSYKVMLAIQPHFGGWEFDGQENLGKLAGGVYSYEGRASPTNFFSTYRSKYDHGTFEMRRPD